MARCNDVGALLPLDGGEAQLTNNGFYREKVQRLLRASIASETRRAYASRLKHFSSWCEEEGVPAFPTSPEILATYVAHLADQGAACSTVGQTMTAISAAHKAEGLTSPTDSLLIKKLFKGYRREHGTAPHRKDAATVEIVRAMLAVTLQDNSPKAIRDAAVIALGFAGAFRRSELSALNMDNLKWTLRNDEEVLLITVRRSKTDQEGQGMIKAIFPGREENTSPTALVRRWLALLGNPTDGPLFREVLNETGITATAGIGTNLYLAKIAMDIVAKHVPADKDGVRIAELDERSYREQLRSHEKLTDFWRIGHGIERRLLSLGCRTMGDVARLSIRNEERLYKTFGINAELIIDHAWGWDPTEISMIKSYKPETNSISSGQVLPEPYDFEKGKLIVREMTELLTLELVSKGVVTKKIGLYISYDRASLTVARQGRTIRDSVYNVAKTGQRYSGVVTADHYGRPHPKHAQGTWNTDRWTSSTRRIMEVMMNLFDRIVDHDLLIRRVNVVALNIINEDKIPPKEPEQFDLFTDYSALEKKRAVETTQDEKERKLQETTLLIQSQYGKNALLKGFNFQEGGTTIARNEQIGSHRAGDDTIQPVEKTITQNTETKATIQQSKPGTETRSVRRLKWYEVVR